MAVSLFSENPRGSAGKETVFEIYGNNGLLYKNSWPEKSPAPLSLPHFIAFSSFLSWKLNVVSEPRFIAGPSEAHLCLSPFYDVVHVQRATCVENRTLVWV